jgi:hypothetical protein
MIPITNVKVAGLEPQWAPYRGFSLLFDYPDGTIQLRGENLNELKCSLDSPGLKLYKALDKSLDNIGRNMLIKTFLFCPLPPYSYHVTVWDGLNDANAQKVSGNFYPKLRNFLNNLQNSLLTDDQFIEEIYEFPLTATEWPIEFRFDHLSNWDNQVLVARLEPTEKSSGSPYDLLLKFRNELTQVYEMRYKIKMFHKYLPHVSLGYFANKQYGAGVTTSQLDHWTKIVKQEVGDKVITFKSISLYGFTDMVTFFKINCDHTQAIRY